MSLLIFLIFIFWIMLFSLPPTITIGDVAELVGSASTLGIAHSPGYPLFCNLYKIFTTFIPFGDYGYKAAVGSLILCIISGIVLFKFFKESFDVLVGWFCITYFFTQESLLNQSIIGEVFSLHILLCVLIFYFMFSERLCFTKKLYIVAFLFGLSIGNQHIVVFLLPGVIIWFLYIFYKEKQTLYLKNVIFVFLFFILGISIYLYVPLRSFQEPLYDWEDPQTLDRFLYLFRRARYGTLSLAQGGKFSLDIENFVSSVKLFLHIISLKNVIFIIFGITLLIFNRHNKNLLKVIVLFINIFFSGIVLTLMSELRSITENNVYILERLLVTAIVNIVFLVGFSFSLIKNKILLYLLIIINIILCSVNFKKVNLRKNLFLYDYTNNIFRNIPKNSILISDRADETEFCIAYFQRLKKKRQDIKFIDANASVTRNIYGDNYYKIWGQPRLEIRNKVETGIVLSNRNVFYNTVLPQQTSIKKYKFGLLHSTYLISNQLPYEIFLIRNHINHNFIREKSLYLTYLELLGSYYIELSEDDKVVKKIYKELFLLTNDIKYLSFIPYYYYSKGNYLFALNEYKKLLEYPIKDISFYSDILINLSIVYQQLNDYKNAEKYLLEAKKVFPQNSKVYYNLGVLYWKQNLLYESLKNFEKYVELNPSDKEVLRYINTLKERIKI